ncbi:MAG: hypothetical protein JKY27_00225 [Magnetovibrio sp.]|nr:hypothetical protein [Magnetovibrio sp.]
MGDQDRLDLILSQARIAKAAMAEQSSQCPSTPETCFDQALLAIEAIELLADPEFHSRISTH